MVRMVTVLLMALAFYSQAHAERALPVGNKQLTPANLAKAVSQQLKAETAKSQALQAAVARRQLTAEKVAQFDNGPGLQVADVTGVTAGDIETGLAQTSYSFLRGATAARQWLLGGSQTRAPDLLANTTFALETPNGVQDYHCNLTIDSATETIFIKGCASPEGNHLKDFQVSFNQAGLDDQEKSM